MMNDCQDVDIREALPDLVHGTLTDAECARVQRHVEVCGDCAAELAIVRAVAAGAGAAVPAIPEIDVSRIAAAIPPYRRKQSRVKRVYLELAAASVIGAVGITSFALHSGRSSSAGAGSAVISSLGAGSGLALVNISDLSDDGLAQLTQDLDQIQALPPADPESVTPVAFEEYEPVIAAAGAGDSA